MRVSENKKYLVTSTLAVEVEAVDEGYAEMIGLDLIEMGGPTVTIDVNVEEIGGD